MLFPRRITPHLALSLVVGVAVASGCAVSGEAESGSPASDDDGGSSIGGSSYGAGGGEPTGPGPGSTTGGSDGGTGGQAGEVDPGPADVTAGLLYINQRVYREDDAFAQGGIAKLELYDPQPLPPDERPEFFNADGERCTFETDSEWPQALPGGGTWPEGPFLDAGDLTLTAASAPGPVVYEYFDSYYLRLSPGPVKQGSFTHNFFFPPEYLPHGDSVTVAAAGGADLGSLSASGLKLADDYVVYSPNLVTGENVIDTGGPLTFSWSPPAPGDKMAVIVKDSFSYVKCVFDDDGHAVVPADAMGTLLGGQFVRITVQTWREHHDTVRVEAAGGEQVDVAFTSRHVQIGRFPSQ
jgi:hypothetical protein